MSNQTTDKLTSILLDGKNYNRQTTFGLIVRDKIEYINGEITILVSVATGAPTEDEKKVITEW
jgi:hypothetical protein